MPHDEAKPVLAHLEELRATIIHSIAALVLGMVFVAYFAPDILTLIKYPLKAVGKDPETFAMELRVVGGLSVAIQVVFWSGLLLSAPSIVYFIAKFIFPGLLEQEKKAIVGSAFSAILLFIIGVITGFFCIQYALKFMFWITEWMEIGQQNILITDYVSFVLKMLLGFGLAFQFPVVIYILGILGLVEVAGLREKRRHVFVGILFMSMMLTPQDPLTMLIMAVPLHLLYEGCIILLALREKREAQNLYDDPDLDPDR